jgi:L-iditol 2-dehydrogenase
MKALVLSEYGRLDLIETEKPIPAPDELLIRIRACGICGSDVHGFYGESGRRQPPIVMGHEAAGIVENAGVDVLDFKPGDRVTFDSTIFCGKCFYCRRAQVNLCEHREVVGVSTPEYRRAGAFAEYIVVPQRVAYRLPEGMPFEQAALIEAASVAIHAVSLTPLAIEDTVIVVGAGMIGLLTMQVALQRGAGRVLVIDLDEGRLRLAREMGASLVLDSRDSNMRERVLAETEGRGADVVLECVGIAETVDMSIASIRKGGTVTLIGNVTSSVDIGLQSVVTRQIRLQGSCASAGEYPEAISLLARKAINVEPLLSVIAPLEDGGMWFQRLYNREPGLLKVVLQP